MLPMGNLVRFPAADVSQNGTRFEAGESCESKTGAAELSVSREDVISRSPESVTRGLRGCV